MIESGEGHGNVSTAKINGYHGGGLPPGESLKRKKSKICNTKMISIKTSKRRQRR
jgi:hypothetical protein